jgi:hypothetical protein
MTRGGERPVNASESGAAGAVAGEAGTLRGTSGER